MHTRCCLLWKKIWLTTSNQLLASISFCAEGHDSLKNKYLGLNAAEQAVKILAA